MRKCHREFRQKRNSLPAQSWGTFVGYCVPQLIAVCVLYTEIKISTLFEKVMRFIRKLNLALLLGHPICVSLYRNTWRIVVNTNFGPHKSQ